MKRAGSPELLFPYAAGHLTSLELSPVLSQTTFQAMYSESRPAEYEAPRLPFWACPQTSVLRVRDLTTSRRACRAALATESRSRLPVGARDPTELEFAAALQAMSGRSQKR